MYILYTQVHYDIISPRSSYHIPENTLDQCHAGMELELELEWTREEDLHDILTEFVPALPHLLLVYTFLLGRS